MAANANELVIIPTRRGSTLISYRGYMYNKRRTTLDTVYWRCRDRLCSATLKTNTPANGQYASPEPMQPHSHAGNIDEVDVERTRAALKRRAETELTPVPALYREEQGNLLLQNPGAAAMLPTFQ